VPVARYSSRRQRLSRKEIFAGLLFFLLMLLAIVYGIYLGIWLLKKEEAQDASTVSLSLQLRARGVHDLTVFRAERC
jgi:hypothetical protein